MDLRRLLISFILIQLKGDFFFKNASFKFMIWAFFNIKIQVFNILILCFFSKI